MPNKLFLIPRAGRRLFWRKPALYWAFGVARGRGNCFEKDFDLWIEGYPRSANTFCAQAFRMANPTARIRSHRHIPPFTIQALAYDKPGIFLLRKPVDAAVSWAIYQDTGVGECLDYYFDFHLALRPYLPVMFIASFEQVTGRFERVIDKFNRRFGTRYASVENDPTTIDQRCADIEQSLIGPRDPLDHRRTTRPSSQRALLKQELLEHLQHQPALKRRLDKANDLYLEFRSGAKSGLLSLGSISTGQVPTLS